MEQAPGQPAPAPAQSPQVVQPAGGGTSWSKIAFTIAIIVVAAAIIVGVYWFFIGSKSSGGLDLGPIKIPKITKTASPSATATGSATPSANNQ